MLSCKRLGSLALTAACLFLKTAHQGKSPGLDREGCIDDSVRKRVWKRRAVVGKGWADSRNAQVLRLSEGGECDSWMVGTDGGSVLFN